MCRVLISGGGTGGHIFPAIAIANALKNRKKNAHIKFVGAIGRMEMQKVPEAGYEIEGLWISGMSRKRSLKNLLLPLKVLVSLCQSWWMILRFKPDVVIGVGGYASGPLLFVATFMGVPTAIQEQNGYAGLTNRLLSRRVDSIFVAFPNMDRFFPKDKIHMVGNPVRDVFLQEVNVQRARQHFGLDPGKKTLLIFGGSLGAKAFNTGLSALSKVIADRSDVQWLWQMGGLYFNDFKDCETAQLDNVHPMEFIRDMDLAYAAADVVISRAGALTLAELALCGKAAILVPSPNVAEDHQTQNARALVDDGAALLCREEVFLSQITEMAFSLLDDPLRSGELKAAIRRWAKPEATENIAQHILDMI